MSLTGVLEASVNKKKSDLKQIRQELLNRSQEECVWKKTEFCHLREIFKSGSLFRFPLSNESASFSLTCPCILFLCLYLFPSQSQLRSIPFFPPIPATSFFSWYNSGFSMVDFVVGYFRLCAGSYMHHCNPIVIVLIFKALLLKLLRPNFVILSPLTTAVIS